jgi:hypothetical protein
VFGHLEVDTDDCGKIVKTQVTQTFDLISWLNTRVRK